MHMLARVTSRLGSSAASGEALQSALELLESAQTSKRSSIPKAAQKVRTAPFTSSLNSRTSTIDRKLSSFIHDLKSDLIPKSNAAVEPSTSDFSSVEKSDLTLESSRLFFLDNSGYVAMSKAVSSNSALNRNKWKMIFRELADELSNLPVYQGDAAISEADAISFLPNIVLLHCYSLLVDTENVQEPPSAELICSLVDYLVQTVMNPSAGMCLLCSRLLWHCLYVDSCSLASDNRNTICQRLLLGADKSCPNCDAFKLPVILLINAIDQNLTACTAVLKELERLDLARLEHYSVVAVAALKCDPPRPVTQISYFFSKMASCYAPHNIPGGKTGGVTEVMDAQRHLLGAIVNATGVKRKKQLLNVLMTHLSSVYDDRVRIAGTSSLGIDIEVLAKAMTDCGYRLRGVEIPALSSVCPACSVEMQKHDLLNYKTDELCKIHMATINATAQASKSVYRFSTPEEFETFTRFYNSAVKQHGHFDAVIDANNVAAVTRGTDIKLRRSFKFSGTENLIQSVNQLTERGYKRILVLARRHLNIRAQDFDRKCTTLYFLSNRSIEDLYLIYVSLSSGCLYVSNDLFNDHFEELKETAAHLQMSELMPVFECFLQYARVAPCVDDRGDISLRFPPLIRLHAQADQATGIWHVPVQEPRRYMQLSKTGDYMNIDSWNAGMLTERWLCCTPN